MHSSTHLVIKRQQNSYHSKMPRSTPIPIPCRTPKQCSRCGGHSLEKEKVWCVTGIIDDKPDSAVSYRVRDYWSCHHCIATTGNFST